MFQYSDREPLYACYNVHEATYFVVFIMQTKINFTYVSGLALTVIA